MRVIKYRAARRAELLPARAALKQPRPFVLALCTSRHFRNPPYFSAMRATDLTIRPAHLLDVIDAIIFGLEFLHYVYELHNAKNLSLQNICVKCEILTKYLL